MVSHAFHLEPRDKQTNYYPFFVHFFGGYQVDFCMVEAKKKQCQWNGKERKMNKMKGFVTNASTENHFLDQFMFIVDRPRKNFALQICDNKIINVQFVL